MLLSWNPKRRPSFEITVRFCSVFISYRLHQCITKSTSHYNLKQIIKCLHLMQFLKQPKTIPELEYGKDGRRGCVSLVYKISISKKKKCKQHHCIDGIYLYFCIGLDIRELSTILLLLLLQLLFRVGVHIWKFSDNSMG